MPIDQRYDFGLEDGTPLNWLYVAPQRIRAGRRAHTKYERWEDIEYLNVQRLARVFEFHGCIGFVGSGASADLGYPPWDELFPREEYTNTKEALRERAKTCSDMRGEWLCQPQVKRKDNGPTGTILAQDPLLMVATGRPAFRGQQPIAGNQRSTTGSGNPSRRRAT